MRRAAASAFPAEPEGVGEPEIEGTVDNQRHPNQRDEQQRIFAQQAFARF
jgi:hypothetical protein